MSLIEEIKEKRAELDELEKQYILETPVCQNKECGFYREKQNNNCSWTTLLEDCRDYIT